MDLPVSEREFAEIVDPDIQLLRECIEKALVQAAKDANQVDLVTRTGGSSRIRAFTRMLQDLFGPDRVVERHLFNTVVTGLASEARREWGTGV
jgi:molecular chaperone DnaK (HSP70)